MLATEQLPDNVSAKSKPSRTFSQPFMQSEICSNIVTPVPPSERSTRHEALSRRRRKTPQSSTALREASQKQSRQDNSAVKKQSSLRNLGLQIRPEKLIWKGWEPGEEYTKNFTLKNINVQTKKIKYKAPSTMFFSTLFPQVIILSAGTSFTLPITFKPLQRQKYEDKMVFSTSHGSFTLDLHGLLPETSLHIPKSLHFGLSAVHEPAELLFEIKNMSGELETDFAWDVPEPFTLEPRRGSLPPKANAWIQATFCPTAATVYDASVVCFYGDNLRKAMRMEGVGKYPHLLVSSSAKVMAQDSEDNAILSFDPVAIRKTAVKHIFLHNLSNVKAPFKLKRCDGMAWMDEVFTCGIDHGMVPPMGLIKIPISYSPHIPNKTDVDYFEVSTVECISKTMFQCVGQSEGPELSLSTSLLHFGLVQDPDTSSRRSFQIHNYSNCDAIFQVDLDTNSGVFRVNERSGLIRAKQSKTIILTFNPASCINYYRKLVILVHNQGPLYIDLIGTFHNDVDKPPPLRTDHLERYKIHESRGLSFYPPNILKQQCEEGKLIVDASHCYMVPGDDEAEMPEPKTEDAMAAYFDDGHNTEVTTSPPHVSLSEMSVWFGEVDFTSEKPPVHRTTVQLSNHTYGKITVHWIDEPSGVFHVVPDTCDILPHKTVEFRVLFRPGFPDKMYGVQLECYVTYKVMRDFQLVDKEHVFPPWLLTLDVSGHTFNGKSETFYPEVSLEDPSLVFSSALPHRSTYRTLLLENNGTTPFMYQLMKNQKEFCIKPAQGFEQSKYNVSVIRFNPSAVKLYESDLVIRYNDNKIFDKTLKMIGTGEQPELLLSNSGEMFFRPTCVHSSVSRGYEVRNVGRSACYFKWVVLKEDATNLSVNPEEGIILPNQTQEHQWTFAPTEQKKHVFKAMCLVWPADSKQKKPKNLLPTQSQKYKLRIVAEATIGEVRAEKYKIELGSVIAGSSKSELLSFYNDSHTDLHVKFFVKQVIDSQYGENPDETEPMSLKLSKVLTTVPARSKVNVLAMARPYRRVFYTWHIYYQLQSADGEPIHSSEKFLLCEINAEGVYPTLAVVDARPSGTGASISKTQLWRWFSIDNLNSCLDSDPDKAELRYSLATRHSATRRPSTYTKSIMDFNFGAAGVGSEPCYVSIMVKNIGSVPTQWSFLFPKDLELEIDYWAETGLFDSDELHELHIQDNKLFEVCPNHGVLNPGEHRTLLFIYKHDIPGTHRVPVLLKIENGKEILLNFVGVTVEPNRRYLHFPGTKHVFTPVPIGELTPPKQLYEMFNGGSMSVLYEVDLSPLLLLETENFNHPILTCLNPKGEIAPGMSSNLEWVFSPLESKTYTIDVPIHIVGGETALITFKGIGYDGRVMGGSMPSLDQPPEYTSVPGTQKVAVPGQILFLSEERISFGNLPLFGKARHIIFLTNQSENRPLTYSWHATSSVVNEVLSIEPIQGHLKPGQSTMVKIVFCASGQPSFYDLDLVCEIVDEVSMAEYYAELKGWKEERDRQAVEFEITGDVDDTQPSVVRDTPFEIYSGPAKYELSSPKRNLDNILNKSQTPFRLTDSDMSKSVTKSEFKTFKTLPPIRFEDPVKAPSNRSRLVRHQEASAKHEWLRPQAPNPSIAHLGVTARTHDIAQFRLHFTGASDKHFIDRTMQIDNPVVAKTPDQPQYSLTTCSGTEKKMVVSIMSDVIRGLLDDPTFHSAAKELEKEETPYFGQLPKDGENKDVESSELTNGRTTKLTSGHQTVPTSSPLEEKPDGAETKETPTLQLMSDMLDQNEPDVWNSQTFEGNNSEAVKRRSSSFGAILEDVISSTISNIMEEAMKGEVLLTVRPRVVALPPSRNPSSSSCKPLNETNLRKSATSKSETVRGTQSPKKSCGSSIAGSIN